MALDFRNTKESNNKENNELKEVFNWFSNNEHFLNDVKDILNEQSKGANALKQLEEQYKTRLETTSYKKHFNSLLTIIHFLSETGKPEVIDNLLQVVNTKNEVRKHHEEVERETKGRILVTKIAQA
jgi:hypothetical protein